MSQQEMISASMRKGVFDRVARNMVRMGYFRTDDPTMDAVISHFHTASSKVKVLDPCCGEGLALADFKRLGNVETYGIELDADRANKARDCVDRVVHSSYDDVSISNHAFGVLFLNPPYGDSAVDKDGKTHRLEIEFLRKTLHYIAPGGVLVYIIPNTSLTDGVITTLSRFHDLRVYRACDATYKQLVIMGVCPHAKSDVDVEYRRVLIEARDEIESVPAIAALDEPVYEIPLTRPVDLFRPIRMSPHDVRAFLDRHAVGNELIGRLRRREKVFGAPLQPVRDGHLGTLVSAGALDGKININGSEVLLKGSSFRVAETVSDGDVAKTEAGDNRRETIIHRTVSEITTVEFNDDKAVVTVIGRGAPADDDESADANA